MKISRYLKVLSAIIVCLPAALFALAPMTVHAAPFSASDYSGIDCSSTIDASKVRFSQDSIAAKFGNGDTVQSLIDELDEGDTKASDVPAIRLVLINPKRVVKPSGNMIAAGVYTLDNRRLYAFQSAAKKISCTKTGDVPSNQRFKFTTDNDGTSITVR